MDVYYDITSEGLVFTADAETRQEIQDLYNEGRDFAYIETEVFEYALCNGLSWIYPEDIGALTSSPILSEGSYNDDGSYEDDAPVYWYPNYQVSDYCQVLADTGKVTFTEAE